MRFGFRLGASFQRVRLVSSRANPSKMSSWIIHREYSIRRKRSEGGKWLLRDWCSDASFPIHSLNLLSVGSQKRSHAMIRFFPSCLSCASMDAPRLTLVAWNWNQSKKYKKPAFTRCQDDKRRRKRICFSRPLGFSETRSQRFDDSRVSPTLFSPAAGRVH